MTRMTHNTLLVLRALMAAPDREMYGLEIMRASSLPSGTVYPLLDRAEAAGWAQARDEVIDPKGEGRPRRKYYRITPQGAAAARAEMEREAARLSALGVTPALPQPAPLNTGGIGIPVITGTGPDLSDWLSPEDSAYDEPASTGPCEHRRPPGSYCTRCGRLI